MLHINIKQKFQFWSEGSESLIFLAKTPYDQIEKTFTWNPIIKCTIKMLNFVKINK